MKLYGLIIRYGSDHTAVLYPPSLMNNVALSIKS